MSYWLDFVQLQVKKFFAKFQPSTVPPSNLTFATGWSPYDVQWRGRGQRGVEWDSGTWFFPYSLIVVCVLNVYCWLLWFECCGLCFAVLSLFFLLYIVFSSCSCLSFFWGAIYAGCNMWTGRSRKIGAIQKQCNGSFIAWLDMAQEHVPVAMGSPTLDVGRRNSSHDLTFWKKMIRANRNFMQQPLMLRFLSWPKWLPYSPRSLFGNVRWRKPTKDKGAHASLNPTFQQIRV